VGGIKNGALLKLIEGEGLHVFLTGDKNVQNQRQLKERPFAVLVMSAINWPVVQTHVSKISDAIDATEAGTLKAIAACSFQNSEERASKPPAEFPVARSGARISSHSATQNIRRHASFRLQRQDGDQRFAVDNIMHLRLLRCGRM